MNPKEWLVSLSLASALSVAVCDAHAQSNDCGKATVFYANGAISYSQGDATPNVAALRTALAVRLSQLSAAERQQIPAFDVALAWVPSATDASQTNLIQALYDSVRAAIGLPSYADGLANTHLTNYYLPALNAGRRVVTVSHSYGNLVTNQVASKLVASGFADSIGVMAVASVTTPTPITNYDYVTFTTDKAIQALADLSVGASVPNMTAANPAALTDPVNHTFLGAYMQDAGAEIRIVDTILRQLRTTKSPARCTPPPPPPANPIVIFDNLGDLQLCSGAKTCNAGIRFGGALSGENARTAYAFTTPIGVGFDLLSVELPVTLSMGSNLATVSVRRDIGGLPDTTSVVASKNLTDAMKLGLPTLLLVSFDPGVAALAGGARYWVEISAPALDTDGAWLEGPSAGGFGKLAFSVNEGPYSVVGSGLQLPLRVVGVPH